MLIERRKYLDKLIASEGNGLVKIITGGRRCGKSFLLFTIFHQYLIERGVSEDHIIELSLDDWSSRRYRNPDILLDYIVSHVQKDGLRHYIILDEIQLVDEFVEVLLSLMHHSQLDIYVSGSNSRFLSKDVVTEFRGRGDEIRVWPLSFSEYISASPLSVRDAWKEYYTYGGLPQIMQMNTDEKKIDYLRNLYELTYLKDIIDRHHLRNEKGMRQILQVLASSIGSSTNPRRLSNTFQSVEDVSIKESTIKEYIGHIQDAFMIEESLRFDVKGRKYIGTETKYYFSDMGLRAVALNFRQQEENHIMENIIYNELRMRGYLVDVGMVETWKRDENGKNKQVNLEVDFVVNKGSERIYIQSAYRMPTGEKESQEHRPLLHINDNFKKIIIVGDDIKPKTDEQGIKTIGLFDFLLDSKSLDI